jgi:hypothetical protein
MRDYCLHRCRGRCATCATKDSLDAGIYESGVRACLAKADLVHVSSLSKLDPSGDQGCKEIPV